ncbi:MAG: hypothetical protein AAFW70_20735 [Cyanobacteria bacterium J06635_10]
MLLQGIDDENSSKTGESLALDNQKPKIFSRSQIGFNPNALSQ